MKRRTQIFIAIVVFVLLSMPIFAQTPIPVVPTIVQGETVFAQVKVANFSVPNEFRDLLLNFLATVFSSVQIGSNEIKLPALSQYANALYKSTKEPLTPHSIQTNTKDAIDVDVRPFEITGRICIYLDDGSNTLVEDRVVSTTKMFTVSTNPENTIEHSQASEHLGATLARGSIKQKDGLYDYSQPEYAIDIANPLPCDAVFDRDNTTVTIDDSQGINEFQLSTVPLVYKLIEAGTKYLGTILHWQNYYAIYKGTTLNPGTARTYCSFVGCKDGKDISSVKYEIPESDIDSGGAANAFRPHSLAFTDKIHGGADDQDLDVIGANVKAQTALSYADSIRDSAVKTYCMLLPKSLRSKVLGDDGDDCKTSGSPPSTDESTCDGDTWLEDLNVNSSLGTGSGGSPGTLGYVIPYRSTSCKIPSSSIDVVAEFASLWGSGGQLAKDNVLNEWQDLQSTSLKYKWNPLFMMALWIEESGAGAKGAWHTGCKFGWKKDGNAIAMPQINDPNDGICSQLACTFSHPIQDPGSFSGFMCSYDTVAQNAGGTCPPYGSWQFAQNIYIVYKALLERTGFPVGCGFTADTIVSP